MPPSSGPAPAASAPLEIPKQAHTLTISASAVFLVSLIVQVLGLVATVVFNKTVTYSTSGKELVGTVQLFLIIGSSISGVGDLRLGTAYSYFLARGRPATDLTSTYLVLRLIMVGTAGIILFGLGPVKIFGSTLAVGPTEWTSLGIFVSLPILWSFSTVYNALYVGTGNSLKAQYPSLVESIVRLPILVFVAYYWPTIIGMTVAYAIGAASSALYSVLGVSERLHQFQRSEAKRMFRFAWPLMGSLLLNYLVTNMVPLIINANLDTIQLNIFLLANGWRILVLSLPAAITTPLFPYLAGLHRKAEYEGVRQGTWQALRYSAMILVPGVVALVTYRSVLLNVLGNQSYVGPASLPLAILVIGALPLAFSQIIQSSINAIGRQRLELYITSTQVAVLFGAVFLLMPPWGILPPSQGLIAGSIAVLASSIAALALNTYFMETLIRVHIHPRSIGGIILSAAGAFFVISQFNRYLPHNRYYQLAFGILLGFAVYFAILFLIGEITRQDVRRVGRSVGLPAWFVRPFERICWRETAPDLAPVDLARAPGLRPTELPETFTGDTEIPTIEPLPTDIDLDDEAKPP